MSRIFKIKAAGERMRAYVEFELVIVAEILLWKSKFFALKMLSCYLLDFIVLNNIYTSLAVQI